jgi:hypothetical protein
VQKRKLTEREIEHVVKCFGGCMPDIYSCLTSYIRGHELYGKDVFVSSIKIVETVDRMVADSVQDVTSVTESILDKLHQKEGKKDKDLEKEVWERYMRLVVIIPHL